MSLPNKPETIAVFGCRSMSTVPRCTTRRVGLHVPSTAPQHPVFKGHIDRCLCSMTLIEHSNIAVGAPFCDVASHVLEPPRICIFLSDFACDTSSVSSVPRKTIEVRVSITKPPPPSGSSPCCVLPLRFTWKPVATRLLGQATASLVVQPFQEEIDVVPRNRLNRS